MHRTRSAAWRNRNQVASGIRYACSGAMSPRSSNIAAKPPACSSRSVARSDWSRLAQGFEADRSCFVQRTQSRLERDMPLAAADSGSNASQASTHAQTPPFTMHWATNARARLVLPELSGPASSLIAPTGSPPSSRASTASIEVGATSRTVRGTGLSAEGKRCSRAFSICERSAEAEGIPTNFRLLFAIFLRSSLLVKWMKGAPVNY